MTDPKPKESELLKPAPINISPPIKIENKPEDKKENEPKENNDNKTKKDEKKEEKKEEKKKIKGQQLLNQHVTQIIKSEFEEEEKVYEVDDTYLERLLEALKKGGIIRPKTLFDGSDIDITSNEKDQKKQNEEKKKTKK